MPVIKNALKAAKLALDKQKYDEAAEQAKRILVMDPNNYHAYVYIRAVEQTVAVADNIIC